MIPESEIWFAMKSIVDELLQAYRTERRVIASNDIIRNLRQESSKLWHFEGSHPHICR